MADEVRLWRIGAGDSLVDVRQSSLDLEARIEKWLKDDISILDPGLLVIGQQVPTDFGGFIDLLCVNQAGDLVVVELKRAKTPREITAQVLDYGSWVADLSHERVTGIAEGFLGSGRFEDAFKARFGHDDLPETLNGSHGLVIVASQIDPASERIVKYLSRSYGVNINAATFQYFKDADGHEFLARVFLIEPSEVSTNTGTRGSSKRQPNLTYEQLDALATDSGVKDLYRYAIGTLERHLQKHTTRSSVAFTASIDDRRRTVISLVPQESNPSEGLRFRLYSLRLQRLLQISEAQLVEFLPERHEPWAYVGITDPEWSGFQGFIKSNDEVERLGKMFSGASSLGMVDGQ